MVVEHVVAHVQCLQEHQSQDHPDVPVQLVQVLLRLLVHVVQLLASLRECDDHLVVDIVELPCLATGDLGIVIIVQYFLIIKIDVEFSADPFICLIGFKLVHNNP